MTEHLLIQISDVHLMPTGELLHGRNPRHNLVAGVRRLEEVGLRPDVFVLTGDLANSGDPECYEDLSDIMEGAALASGATVIYLPGNHDRRPEFRRHLLGWPEDPGPINQVHWHDGLRIISLDSSVPDQEFGLLADETIDFLGHALSTPAPDGTIVAVHHPPVPSPITMMERIMLLEGERFEEALAHTDVRLVICGHNHHEGLGSIASRPVWVSPASAYRLDVLSPLVPRDIPGCAFSRIDIGARGVTASVITIEVDA